MIQVRHVEPSDAAQWTVLRLWPEERRGAHDAEVTRFFADPRQGGGTMPEVVLVAVETSLDPKVVGFAEVSRRAYAEGCGSSPVGFLEGWCVVPERRQQGLGRALVAAAEACAREVGAANLLPTRWWRIR